jgi:ParB/RepB/Spo0J family partition protein
MIKENPENPRLVWKKKEMAVLLQSIEQNGIIVPLIIYPEGVHYVLLDGARRLRCARRLNLKEVPANVIAKPTKVQNILHMFHIHNVKEDWELIETAKKLEVLLGSDPFKDKSVAEIAGIVGLTQSTVNRCKELLSLDPKHQDMILETYRRYETGEQINEETRLTEDFFIESKRAIRSIRRFLKGIAKDYDENAILRKFVQKRKRGVLSNVIEIGREIPRIVAAAKKGAPEEKVEEAIRRLIEEPRFTVQEAYEMAAEPVLASVGIERSCVDLIQELTQLRRFGKRELKGRKERLVKVLKDLRSSIDETLTKVE